MNDLKVNESGLFRKAAALLNNKNFSDVDIVVINDGAKKHFPAHKLFLAMNSEKFAEAFYRNPAPSKVHKIFDFKPKIVFMMLEFIYTDQTDLSNTEESKELYSLAKKYAVKDLERYCLNHLAKEDITLDNIFDKYEFAISENIPEALKACRNIASAHTLKILNSPRFTEASLLVIEDILQLDILSIMTELDLIEAAIRWGQQECFRRGSYTENVRFCVYPLFKHLRFLTLTAVEFCDLVEKYDKLLNSHESSLLTRAIIQPSIEARLPSGFSSNSNPREHPTSIPKGTELIIPASNGSSSALFEKNKKKDSWNFDMDLKNHLHDNFGLDKEAQHTFNSNSGKIVEYDGILSQNRNIPFKRISETNFVKRNDGADTFSQFMQNPVAQVSTLNSGARLDEFDEASSQFRGNAAVKHNSNFTKLAQNADAFSQNEILTQNILKPLPVAYNRSDSVPIHIKKPSPPLNKKQPPVLSVQPSPQSSFNQRAFNFPIFDFEKTLGLNSAFTNDIRCSAKICVTKGALEIFGMELKIKQKSSDEVISVHLTLNGSTIRSRSTTCEEKLKNNLLPLAFGEPVKLYTNDYLNVEVEVEELTLNRCSGCRNDKCELNAGLNISADILIKSSRNNNDNKEFFYLFNRLMYRPLY